MNAIDDIYRRFTRTQFPLPTEVQVRELEERLGISMPWEYRLFILSHNGGFFLEPDIVPPSKDCPLDALDFLSGIGASHSCAELGGNTNLFDDNDPVRILPIGYTVMGNLLYMVVDPNDEMPGWIGLKLAFRDQSFWLADDINAFFALLCERQD